MVRWVYPDSPAAAAKIEPGDRIVALAGKPVANRDELLRAMGVLEPGMEAELEVRRGEQSRKQKLTLAALPEGLPPAALPRPAGQPSRARARGPSRAW